jgi:hypothetical protein
MYEPSFDPAGHSGRPLWPYARLLGVVASTLGRAVRQLVATTRLAPLRGPRVDRREAPRIVLSVGVGLDEGVDAPAKPTLERLLELTLELRDGYESQCNKVSAAEFGELSLTCREHGRRQTALARRLTVRLSALGTPLEPAARGSSRRASGVPGEPRELELGRLLASHRAVLNEAKAFGGHRVRAAWTTQEELVVADVIATNRRQAATLMALFSPPRAR